MTEAEAEFVAIFRDEARERLDRIVEVLLALESGRAPDDAIDSLFRDTHTIKGAAGMVGREDIGTLAHGMEDVLADARARGSCPPELIAPLLRSADALRRLVEGAEEPVDALVDELAVGRLAATTTTPPEQAPPQAAAAPPAKRRSIRVPPEKIDTLLDLVGETVLNRRRLAHALSDESGVASQRITDELDAGEHLLDGLRDAAIGMRTLPLSSVVGSLPRAVRDAAVETDKEVELVIEGAETELDRAILESLSDLLSHLLRNAVAHGIETPEQRERDGKPACGRISLRAEQRGGTVEIVVADDGRGVSEKARAEGRRAGSLTDVLTQAGYSTASRVSEISGRGVGLDAVKTQVESFGGSVEVRSEPGEGTEVILRLPLALALLEVLLVERGGRVYGIPLASVEEVLAVGETLTITGRPALALRGRTLPLADLAGLVSAVAPPLAQHGPAVALHSSGHRVAAACDTLLGEEEVIVKSLGSLLAALPAYLGAAILADGRIALLLDPGALVRRVDRRMSEARGEAVPLFGRERRARTVLVVEDSLAVRELQRSILEAAGYTVETARDGREALERLGRDDSIQLVITDVDMPNLNGLELTAAIRRHARLSALPVIVVTSRGDEQDRQRGIDAGADAYMVKQGFDQEALLETVGRLVGR